VCPPRTRHNVGRLYPGPDGMRGSPPDERVLAPLRPIQTTIRTAEEN
jgi:hypothetical protein